MGGSIVALAALVALAVTLARESAWMVPVIACLATYAAQGYYLGTIGRHPPNVRLRIWLLSLLALLLRFAAVLWFVGDPAVAAVLFLPEGVSLALHLAGLRLALQALRAAD